MQSSLREKRPPAPAAGAAQRLTDAEEDPDIKLLLVPFRSGEAVDCHPDLQSWLKDGWAVRSAVPRVVESEGTKLMVVLERRTLPPIALIGTRPSAPALDPTRTGSRP